MFHSPPPAHQALHPRPSAVSPPTQPRSRAGAGSKELGGDGPASTKKAAKDVSHVPCRFFRSGQCSAGSSCVFAHIVAEPGQQKQVCGYFLKGSCKFGHKCALAHIHPGEPMSMDRKNKKAAQLEAQAAARAAAAATNGGLSGQHGEGSGGSGQRQQQQQQQPGRGPNGTTAPGGGDGARPPFANQQQPQKHYQAQPSQLAARPAESIRFGQPPYQHGGDSSLLTLASISHATAPSAVGSNGHLTTQQQRAGTIGSLRTALSGLDLLNSTLAPSSLNPPATSPTLSTRAPHLSPSQTSPTRLPTAPHLSSPSTTAQPHRTSFPVSAQSSAGLFLSGQASRLIPPTSSGASSNGGGNGTGGAGSPFSTSPFAAPGSRGLFLSSSYDAYAQERDGAFPSSLPASTLRPAGMSAGPHAVSGRTRSFLDTSSTAADGNGSLAGEEALNGSNDEEDDDDGEEFLPSSLSELLTEHEMERRMTRRNSNQPHLQRPSFGQHSHAPQPQSLAPGHGLVSSSAAATFPINRLYSDSGLFTKPKAAGPSAGPWIETVPSMSGPSEADDEAVRTISRRHSERPPTGSVFDAFGGGDDGMSKSPPVPQSMFDSTHTLRPNAFGGGGPSSHDDPFRHPSTSPSQTQPARSNLAALWDRSSYSGGSGNGPSSSSSGKTQTRHGFQLSSSPSAGHPSAHLLGTTHQPTCHRHPPSHLASGGGGGGGITQPLMSPSSRALASHAPGMSLPGGLGVTLSRLHFQPAVTPTEDAGTSYTSNGLPDLAGLAFGTVSRHQATVHEQRAAAPADPWRSLDSEGFPALGGETKIHQPTPIKTSATIATRAEEEDEFADDVLFD